MYFGEVIWIIELMLIEALFWKRSKDTDGNFYGYYISILFYFTDSCILQEHDQLIKQKRENKAFGLRTFQESPLNFAPTFKYNRGTDQYDSSEKMRIPAYCDRILYRGAGIQQNSYERHEVKMSDHRPVSGHFTVNVSSIVAEKMQISQSVSQQRVTASLQKLVDFEQQQFMMAFFKIEKGQVEELLASQPFYNYFPNHSD